MAVAVATSSWIGVHGKEKQKMWQDGDLGAVWAELLGDLSGEELESTG